MGEWAWKQPPGAQQSGPHLRLYSSYHNHAVPFVPAAGPNSRQISWYTCGPTVYEVRHVCLMAMPGASDGHAES